MVLAAKIPLEAKTKPTWTSSGSKTLDNELEITLGERCEIETGLVKEERLQQDLLQLKYRV